MGEGTNRKVNASSRDLPWEIQDRISAKTGSVLALYFTYNKDKNRWIIVMCQFYSFFPTITSSI